MRRAFALLVAIVMAFVALPGCGEPPRGVVVWHPYRGGEQKALERIATRFEVERHVSVTLLAIPYEAYLSKLEAAIPRGNGPDVFLGPHNRLGEYLLHGLVVPAGDALPDADLEAYETATVTAITHDSKRWAVPLASKCPALYVNTDLLPAPPRTLDEIAAKKGSLPKEVWPLVYESQSVYYHASILHAFGGTLFANEQFAMVGPEAERSVEKARDLTRLGIVPQEPSGDLVKQLFASGKALTAMSGPWLAGDLEAAGSKVHYEVVPLPAIDGAGSMRPYLTVEGAFLTGEGGAREDARAFARMLGSEPAARERAETGKQVVATRAFWTSPAAAAPSMKVLRAFHEASNDAIPMPVSIAMNPVWVPAEDALKKVIRGEAGAHETLEEAKARYLDIMRPPPPAPSPAPLVALLGAVLLGLAFLVVRRARQPGFRRELRASKPAYKYVIHSVITILVLVVFPLLAGAATSDRKSVV